MFNEYIDKAMHHAHYEQIEDGTYFGRIPGFKGVWANESTEQSCRQELREVLEGWILLNIADHTTLPILGSKRHDCKEPEERYSTLRRMVAQLRRLLDAKTLVQSCASSSLGSCV